MSQRERFTTLNQNQIFKNSYLIRPQKFPQVDSEFPPSLIEQSISECFEKQARIHADRIAVKTPEISLSYAALNQMANRIAHEILDVMVEGSMQVGLVLSKGPLMIGTILGVLKAGKVYVPLDPHFPQKRLAFMLEDAEVSLILTDNAYSEFASSMAGERPILNVEDEQAKNADTADSIPADFPNPQQQIDPTSMAYILYTSGSTGQPKGIAFGHRNLLHTTMCLINKLEITQRERMTQLHSTSFSASVVDIYCALLTGATLYPWDVKQHGFAGLADWLMTERITSLQWIPTPFRHFVETFDGSERFPHLRQIVMASEPLTAKEARLVRQYFPPACRLVNQMGTSESYNYRLYFLSNDTPLESINVPAGYPVSRDREVLILDEDGNELPSGSEGEIAVRSAYMSLGYWKNRALNQKKFLTDPTDPSKQIFLTGDLGYLMADGCLIHLGRKDFQVKIRGYRIELGEIESRLCEMENVKEAIVLAEPMDGDELRLVAYIIPRTGRMPSRLKMQNHLAAALPDYMVPSAYIQLTQLPTTDTGKLDRKALPRIEYGYNGHSLPIASNGTAAPVEITSVEITSAEKELLQIWQEVLGTDRISLHDSFFDLGGNSLKMAQMLQYVHQQFGRKLPYALLMQNPSIADLINWIEDGAQQDPRIESALADTETAIPDGLLRGILNRLWQALALYAPGRKSLRVALHRMRGVSIGQNVAIGMAALIETSYPRLVSIGKNSSIGIRTVIIAHFVDGLGATPTQKNSLFHNLNQSEDGGVLSSRSSANKSVIIEDDVFIGPMVTILPNVTIGRGAVVAAGSVVNQSVPPHTMVQGNPARVVARCPIPLTENYSYEEFLSTIEFLS